MARHPGTENKRPQNLTGSRHFAFVVEITNFQSRTEISAVGRKTDGEAKPPGTQRSITRRESASSRQKWMSIVRLATMLATVAEDECSWRRRFILRTYSTTCVRDDNIYPWDRATTSENLTTDTRGRKRHGTKAPKVALSPHRISQKAKSSTRVGRHRRHIPRVRSEWRHSARRSRLRPTTSVPGPDSSTIPSPAIREIIE